MRTRRIQLSLVTSFLLSQAGLLINPLSSVAQTCSGSIQTVTFDTVLSGTGSQPYSLPLRQFYSPEGYTLLSATLQANLTTTSTLSFENTTNITQTFNPKIARGDEVDLDGDYLTDGSANYNVPHTVLNAFQIKTYGPSTIFNNVNVIDYTIDQSDGTLNSFIGSSNLNLGYTTSTFINNVPLGVNPSATASDDIHFSITYTFCNPITLASNIITFTASRRDEATVALNWIVANEMKGRRYDIEVSTDGRQFVYYGSQSSQTAPGEASYIYDYALRPENKGRLYFRLKQVNQDGTAAWSEVRTVDLDRATGPGGFVVYPNPPTDHINLIFPSAGRNWQTDIIAADGRMVQRNVFNNIVQGTMYFSHRLASGVYFVRITDLQSAASHSTSFVIR
jgi:hypothetical protein